VSPGMQKKRSTWQGTWLRKPLLLAITAAIVIVIALPFTLPHIIHESIIYHSIIHIASIVMASFLSIVSLLAYNRGRAARLLFMSMAFIALVGVELLDFLETVNIIRATIFPLSDIELSHIILLAMFAMFALGVLKVEKPPHL